MIVDDVKARQSLASWVFRIERLVLIEHWTEDELVELFALFNDAARIRFSLDSVSNMTALKQLEAGCARFFDDAVLDDVLRARLIGMRCREAELEAARREFLSQLEGSASTGSEAVNVAALDLSEVVADRAEARRRLLERIGVATSAVSNMSVALHSVLGATNSAPTRGKLARAWQQQTAELSDRLVASVDSLVEARRAEEQGYVLDRTLSRSTIDINSLRAYLDNALAQAVSMRRELDGLIQEILGGEASTLLADFAYAMQVRIGDPSLNLDVDKCIAYALDVARRLQLGVDLAEVSPGLFRGEAGDVLIEPWVSDGAPLSAAFTETLRNRTSWGRWQQAPVVRVQCNLQRSPDGKVGLQSAATLFHEIGHAVNHLLSTGLLPFTQGLFYLPVERRECMSMWFERRAFDEELLLDATSGDVEFVRRIVASKMLLDERDRLERVVAASIDLDLHSKSTGGISESFGRLNALHGISRWCSIGDVASHFSWPRYTSRPGAAVAYILGDSFSRTLSVGADLSNIARAFAPLCNPELEFPLPTSETTIRKATELLQGRTGEAV